MAKSFKGLLNNNSGKIPDSKKDILDLFQDEQSTQKEGVTKVTLPIKPTVETPTLEVELLSKDIRQTFIIGEDYLEKLKDFVHTKRVTGCYLYTQKNALHDALDLLFKDIKLINRPDEIKQKEENRANKIRKGIKVR